jgi:purine-nucleoside phosphorylase
MSWFVHEIEKHVREVREAAASICRAVPAKPQVAVIAGSGLGRLAELASGQKRLPYASIPHYPGPTVAGHRGEMLFGRVGEKRVVVLAGRRHLYEEAPGIAGQESELAATWRVVFPVRVLAELGVKHLILTNAAGGLNPHFEIGDLMLIADQINLSFSNPLIGPNVAEWGPRFPDMAEPFDSELRRIARETAIAEGIKLKEGVYCAALGPSYETRAEVEMLRLIGADAVGMSTVPETLVGIHCGMQILGLSLISNSLVKGASTKVAHEEVLAAASRVESTLLRFLTALIHRI